MLRSEALVLVDGFPCYISLLLAVFINECTCVSNSCAM